MTFNSKHIFDFMSNEFGSQNLFAQYNVGQFGR